MDSKDSKDSKIQKIRRFKGFKGFKDSKIQGFKDFFVRDDSIFESLNYESLNYMYLSPFMPEFLRYLMKRVISEDSSVVFWISSSKVS